jgi:outer membrane protein assembly factor BamB
MRDSHFRRFLWPVLVCGLCSPAFLTSCSSYASTAASSHPLPLATYHGDNARTGYSTDSSITASNAGHLTQRWSVDVRTSLSDQPVVDGGVVYWGDWKGDFHATTVSGRPLWSTFLGTAPKPAVCPYNLATQGVVSSPTIGTAHGQNLVWVGGGAGQVVALNATTGAIVWSTRLGSPPEHEVWASPLLYDGSIYIGVASWNDCPVVDGAFFRLNATTGAIQAVNHLDPSPKCIGPGVWSSASVDPTTNSVYVTTSNANLRSNPNATCQIPEQEAVLKLNSRTLATESVWALPEAQQIGDSDFGGSPMLFSATIDGVNRQLVGAVNKNGIFYAFDRTNLAAGPVWSYTAESAPLAQAASSSSDACVDVNTISSSAWAGSDSPVMVAGLAQKGNSCIGTLAALNSSTGQVEWQTDLPGSIEGAVTEVPGIVAVGAGATVDLLSSSTGQILFSYRETKTTSPKGVIYGAPTGEFWAPPTIAGNTLYVANQDGSLRAFSS